MLNMKRIKGKVFEVSDKDNRVIYPTERVIYPAEKGIIRKLQRKLGALFGTRCPRCYSKNIVAKDVMKAGYKLCIDCEKYFK